MSVKSVLNAAALALVLAGCAGASAADPATAGPAMTQSTAIDEAHALLLTAAPATGAPYAADALFALECAPGQTPRLVYRSSTLALPVGAEVVATVDGAPLPLPDGAWQVVEETRTAVVLAAPLADAALAAGIADRLTAGAVLTVRAPQSPPDVFDLTQARGGVAGCR